MPDFLFSNGRFFRKIKLLTNIFCVLIFRTVKQKTKGFYMSYCVICSNKDSCGNCTYTGNCAVKELKAREEKFALENAITNLAFNPFQRGNGCILETIKQKVR